MVNYRKFTGLNILWQYAVKYASFLSSNDSDNRIIWRIIIIWSDKGKII
jgi:hypothetical protein